MALADILSSLQRDGEAEVAQITAEREATISEVTRRAREVAKSTESEAATSRDAALAAETEVILNRAGLHVERRLQETREVIFQEILGRARDRLSRYRAEAPYEQTLDALVAECLAFLGEAAEVAADSRDVELVTAALARHKATARVKPSLEVWGGVIATDGKGAFVRNTLEERLARVEGELRRQVGDQVPVLRGAAALKDAS